jgi:hypothetical protein
MLTTGSPGSRCCEDGGWTWTGLPRALTAVSWFGPSTGEIGDTGDTISFSSRSGWALVAKDIVPR